MELSPKEVLSSYDSVGIQHNQGLDEIYGQLLVKRDAGTLSKQNAFDVLEKILVQQVKDRNIESPLEGKMIAMIGGRKSRIAGIASTSAESIPKQLYTAELEVYLSNGEKKYLDELNLVVQKKSSSLEEMLSGISKIENSAIDNLGENE